MKYRLTKLLVLANTILLSGTFLLPPALAQFGGQEEGGASGPIDIRANEQEFGNDNVIARGNVRVTYKDSVIIAPEATLYKDQTGNPNRAVFTGHPRLTQSKNKIDAEKLTFEMVSGQIIAEGNAHSEVEMETSEGDHPVEGDKNKTLTGGDSGAKVDEAKNTKSTVAKSSAKKTEKIITDADRQEYNQKTGGFNAAGHVRVKQGDILVVSDKLQLVYGTDGKPETCVFTGNVTATQNKNSTAADTITYSLLTKRLQASGNVRSKVIQEKAEGEDNNPNQISFGLLPATAKSTGKASGITNAAKDSGTKETAKDEYIYVNSDTQDYSKENGRLSARGRVKVTYQEMHGAGPALVMTRDQLGKADKVYFVGRSQISQPGRKWIADNITYIVADKKVVAQGNARAVILQKPGAKDTELNLPGESRMATSGARLSASKVDTTK